MAVKFTCGYCGVSSVSRFKGQVIYQKSQVDWYPYCLVQCDNCARGSMVSFHVNKGSAFKSDGYASENLVIPFEDLDQGAQYPSKKIKIPRHLPNILHNLYEDAEFNFLSHRWKPASQLYLQCLEFAIIAAETNSDENLASESSAQKIDLTSRINDLFKKGKITLDMKEWAHQIRVIGQYHKHRYVDADQTDCEAIRSFLELFTTYLFTLPGMIAAHKAVKSSE